MDEHELHAKRPRTVNFPDLEEALSLLVLQCQHRNVFITYDLIKAQCQRFAEMLKILEGSIEFSNGWLYKFLSRNKLQSFKIHGEAGSVDDDAIEAAMPALRARIAAFNPEDVYNMDETGLFYRMVPDTTITQQRIVGSKKDSSNGYHKLPPFFIGNAQKPRCFNRKTDEQLGFYYRAIKKAWMTGMFFQ